MMMTIMVMIMIIVNIITMAFVLYIKSFLTSNQTSSADIV